MPFPITSTPPASQPLRLNDVKSAGNSPIANKLLRARTEAPASSNSHIRQPPFQGASPHVSTFASESRIGAAPLSLEKAARPEEKTPRLKPEVMREYKIFCTVLGTNTGARNIVEMMQGTRTNLDTTEIMAELVKTKTEKAISTLNQGKPKDRVDLKTDMRTYSSKKKWVQEMAKEIYRSADASKLPERRVYRGQSMTPKGVETLKAWQASGTPVRPRHFLSCSKDVKVAQSFANEYTKEGEEKVRFHFTGYSSMPLYAHLSIDDEKESLFSPYATFKIEKITLGSESKQWVVHLTEIPHDPKARPLPY